MKKNNNQVPFGMMNAHYTMSSHNSDSDAVKNCKYDMRLVLIIYQAFANEKHSVSYI